MTADTTWGPPPPGRPAPRRWAQPVPDTTLLDRLADPHLREDAAEELYRRHRPLVRRICADQMRRDPAAVEDMVHETFARLLANHRQVSDGQRLRQWLTTVARRVCSDARHRRHHTAEAAWAEGLDAPSTEDVEARVADRALVGAGLGTLSAADADMLRMRYLEDRGFDDIAAHMDSTRGSVKVRVHHARRRLRSWVDDRVAALLPLTSSSWVRSLTGESAAVNAAGALVIVGVIGFGVLRLGTGGPMPATTPVEDPLEMSAVVSATAAAAATGPSAPQAALATEAVEGAGLGQPGASQRSEGAAAAPRAPIPMEFQVPGTGLRTTSQRPGPSDYSFDVEGTGEGALGVDVDFDEARPVFEPACQVAEVMPGLHCERDRE